MTSLILGSTMLCAAVHFFLRLIEHYMGKCRMKIDASSATDFLLSNVFSCSPDSFFVRTKRR